MFQDPSRIYNADESGFSLCPKLSKVLNPVGTSTVYSFTNNSKTQITVMACASAAAQRPVLLLVDGHTTHIKLESSKLCSQENIILYCLLEHSSHIMQPLDLRLFSALKESWKFSVRAFQMEHPGELVTKQIFSRVLKKAWDKATTVDNRG